ncbi:Autophagy-related protein [Quillaja saponaria]|uniref:Autophagy-related protein n=1 Tax=Quillaja saponaria TaxID=32244 RepID=A0AAD7PIL7_QUISA|nr:Autophagy-related protein [Quillaja saponaria]
MPPLSLSLRVRSKLKPLFEDVKGFVPIIGLTANMASSHSETEKMEQIITEFFAKGLHIILESRTPYVSLRNFSCEQIVTSLSSSSLSSSNVQPRDKWFNLALRECPAALENIDLWRQSNLEPMVIDVILVQRPVDWNPVSFSPKRDLPKSVSVKERYPFSYNTDQEELGFEANSEKIIERWVLQYEGRKGKDCSSGSRRLSKSNNSTLHTLYKKSTLLLKSLYATVRLLPAYKIFRDLNLSGQILAFNLAHRVSSFVDPFTRREEAEMQKFGFTPVDTCYGRLCLSVLYQSSVSGVSSEPSMPMSPRVIPVMWGAHWRTLLGGSHQFL